MINMETPNNASWLSFSLLVCMEKSSSTNQPKLTGSQNYSTPEKTFIRNFKANGLMFVEHLSLR